MNDDLMGRALRYRWIIFWILASGYILVYFHRLCPAVVAVDMMADLAAGGTLIGILGSVYFYPYAVMQLPAGLLADSWGPRRTISLFFTVVVIGFTTTKELFPVQIAGTATGLVNLFPFAGGALSQPFLGYILEQQGRVDGRFVLAGYQQAFLALFICGILALLSSLFLRETYAGH